MHARYFLIIVALGLSACARPPQASVPVPPAPVAPQDVPLPEGVIYHLRDEPVSFSIGDLDAVVTKQETTVDQDLQYWLITGPAAYPERKEYYERTFADAYKGKPEIRYIVLYRNDQNYGYGMVLMPNALGYGSLEAIKKDFIATDPGILKPVIFNKEWIVFVLHCQPGDEKCQALEDVILPSLQLR